MSNSNYICFQCRTSARHPATAAKVPKCLICGETCYLLGSKAEIPKHKDTKGWIELEAECRCRDSVRHTTKAHQSVRLKHDLEQEIQRLAQRPDNPDRNRQIKKLEQQLAKITGRQSNT